MCISLAKSVPGAAHLARCCTLISLVGDRPPATRLLLSLTGFFIPGSKMHAQPRSGLGSAMKLTLWSLAAGIIFQLSKSMVLPNVCPQPVLTGLLLDHGRRFL